MAATVIAGVGPISVAAGNGHRRAKALDIPGQDGLPPELHHKVVGNAKDQKEKAARQGRHPHPPGDGVKQGEHHEVAQVVGQYFLKGKAEDVGGVDHVHREKGPQRKRQQQNPARQPAGPTGAAAPSTGRQMPSPGTAPKSPPHRPQRQAASVSCSSAVR